MKPYTKKSKKPEIVPLTIIDTDEDNDGPNYTSNLVLTSPVFNDERKTSPKTAQMPQGIHRNVKSMANLDPIMTLENVKTDKNKFAQDLLSESGNLSGEKLSFASIVRD